MQAKTRMQAITRMQAKTQSHNLCSWIGPDAYFDWLESCKSRQKEAVLDVVLITHPRDEDDLPRMFSWSKSLARDERTSLTRHLKPAFGEVIETKSVRVGVIFLPVYAKDIIQPSTRAASRSILQDCAFCLFRRIDRFSLSLRQKASSFGKRVRPYADHWSLGYFYFCP